MQIIRDLGLPGPPSNTFGHVDDLGRYPVWMPLVRTATGVPADPSDPAGAPGWVVELQAQVGPFARSKRLRMVRTLHGPPIRVRFERAEIDGRSHSSWTLDVELEPIPDGTRLVMTLSYGGGLWAGAVLQRVLDDEITRGSDRLLKLVTAKPPP